MWHSWTLSCYVLWHIHRPGSLPGLTDFPNREHPFYTVNRMVGWHHDDVMMFQIVVMTRIDDITRHNYGNHGRLLLDEFIVNPYFWQQTDNCNVFLTNSGTINILKEFGQQLQVIFDINIHNGCWSPVMRLRWLRPTQGTVLRDLYIVSSRVNKTVSMLAWLTSLNSISTKYDWNSC